MDLPSSESSLDRVHVILVVNRMYFQSKSVPTDSENELSRYDPYLSDLFSL
jgi:hypothetical protein